MRLFLIAFFALVLCVAPFSAVNAFDCSNIKLPSTAIICTDTYLMAMGNQLQRSGIQPALMPKDTWARTSEITRSSSQAIRPQGLAPVSAQAPVPPPVPAPVVALDSFPAMDRDTGCHSNYSEQRKADPFAQKYQDRVMTLRGEIGSLDQSRIGLKILPSTITTDIYIELADPKAGYDLRKGSNVTVRFTMRNGGGCFLDYAGDGGVVLEGGN